MVEEVVVEELSLPAPGAGQRHHARRGAAVEAGGAGGSARAAARPLDDLVLRVRPATPDHPHPDAHATVYVQLWHAEGQLAEKDFVEEGKKTHLAKYFVFFRRLHALHTKPTIQKTPETEDDNRFLSEGSLDDAQCVLYTTKCLPAARAQPRSPARGLLADLESLLRTDCVGTEDSTFFFTAEDTQVWNLFHGKKFEEVYRREFLPRFRVLCNQSQANHLDGLITEELNKLFSCSLPNARYHCMDYIQLLKRWVQDENSNYCLNESSGDVEWVLAQDVRRHARLVAGGGAITFKDAHCIELRSALSVNHLRVVVSDVPVGLRAAKLLQVLDRMFPNRWLYTNSELLTQFPAPALIALCKVSQVDVLVVDADEMNRGLSEVINAVVGQVKVVEVCSVAPSGSTSQIQQLKEDWELEHLVCKPGEEFLDRPVFYKSQAWNDISIEYNATTASNRTVKQLRDKFGGLKKEARKYLGRVRQEVLKTGGGQATAKKTVIICEKVQSILGNKSMGMASIYDDDNEMPMPAHETEMCTVELEEVGVESMKNIMVVAGEMNDVSHIESLMFTANAPVMEGETFVTGANVPAMEGESSVTGANVSAMEGESSMVGANVSTMEEPASNGNKVLRWATYSPQMLRRRKHPALDVAGPSRRRPSMPHETVTASVSGTKLHSWATARIEVANLQKELLKKEFEERQKREEELHAIEMEIKREQLKLIKNQIIKLEKELE